MSESAARPKPTISRGEWGILLLLAAIQFTNVLDFVIMMPLAPWAKLQFDINSTEFSHAVGVYGIASALSSLMAAKYLDRFPRKSVLLAMYAGFTLSNLFCGLAPTYEWLVAARGMAGAFGGVLGSAVMAIIGDIFADYRRGTAMGVVMSAFAVSSVVGIPIGLTLARARGVGAPFVALAALSTIVWLGVARVFPHIPAHPDRRPVPLHALIAHSGHLLALAFTMALVMGSFIAIPFLADSMVANAGQVKEDMPIVYAIAGGFTFFTTNISGRLADRYGKLRVFRIMGFLAVVMILVVTNLPPISLWLAVMIATAFMVTTSARMVPAQALITGSAIPAMRGGFLSLNSAMQSAAMGLSSFIGGALIGQTADGRLPGYPLVGLVAASMAIVSLVLAGFLRSAEVSPVRVPAREEPAVVEASA
ncbi:MAG TPA: MFS transporter [Gemmataceae bacterium]|nr:MFS transporter [Gemmataceae bacterium]